MWSRHENNVLVPTICPQTQIQVFFHFFLGISAMFTYRYNCGSPKPVKPSKFALVPHILDWIKFVGGYDVLHANCINGKFQCWLQ